MPTSILPEQRKVARVDLQAHVEIDLPRSRPAILPTTHDGASLTRLKADSLNLSEGGMCVRLQENLEIRSRIRLRLFAEDSKRPLECAGQVAWVVQRLDLRDSPPFLYDVGVRFIDPPQRLRQFASRAGLTMRPLAERPRPQLLEPAVIHGRRYMPHLDREASSGLWHLTVWVDGVPCFSHRYPAQREAVKAWETFQADTAKPVARPTATAPRARRSKNARKRTASAGRR